MDKNAIFCPKKTDLWQFSGKIEEFPKNEKGIADYTATPFL